MLKNYICSLVLSITIKNSLINTPKSSILNQVYYKKYLIILKREKINSFQRIIKNIYTKAHEN